MAGSKATLAFLEAISMEEGCYVEYEFSSKKEADSFRVSLYAEKRRLNDNTVLVAISNNIVRLTKKSAVVVKRVFSPDGKQLESKPEVENISFYEKKVQEIMEMANDFEEEDKRNMFISDALRNLHRSVK